MRKRTSRTFDGYDTDEVQRSFSFDLDDDSREMECSSSFAAEGGGLDMIIGAAHKEAKDA